MRGLSTVFGSENEALLDRDGRFKRLPPTSRPTLQYTKVFVETPVKRNPAKGDENNKFENNIR